MNYETVYTSELGDLRKPPKTQKKVGSAPIHSGLQNDGIIRVRRETKGRGGKTATLIYGIPFKGQELELLAKKLKQICGTGGQAKDGIIMIQGDKVDSVVGVLEKDGYKVKRAGG